MSSIVIVLAAISVLILIKQWLTGKPPHPYPPGPKPLPVIGNLLDLPTKDQWKTYAEWKARWGDVISVTVLGQRTLILNSLEPAIDLLEKKSAIYADRPRLPMAGDLLGWSQQLVFSPYGDHFRSMRKMLQKYLGGRGQLERIAPYHDLIESETHKFLVRTLQGQSDFHALHNSIRKTSGAITLQIGYGYQVKEGEDDIVEMVDRALSGFDRAAIPGSYLVDILPALKWVPSWFPGAAWKRQAKIWRNQFEEMAEVPYVMSKEQALTGSAVENIVDLNISQEDMTPEQEYHLKMAVSSLYAGGTDTTVSVMMSFFLAMTLYPDVQKKAQQEIDSVIGNDRLPTLQDREQLPYIRALVSEIFRWNPTIPLGIPHRSTEDDVYRGYFIPKGTTVIVNHWHLFQDPEVYSEPHVFKPERFLGDKPEQDMRVLAFGFGRRICPGLNLAETTTFAFCSMMLAAFNISKAVKNGKEITPDVAFGSGAVSHPLPFELSVTPRSKKAEALVLA